MAKRSKELFELLGSRSGTDAARSTGTPKRDDPNETAGARADSEPRKRSAGRTKARREPEPAARAEDEDADGVLVADAPMGQRRVEVSLNLLLFFIVAFVLTNIMSYMVGSMGRSGAPENYGPLAVPVDQYWTIQVTRPLPESEWQFAWDIQEILEREGYRSAQVSRLRMDGVESYRTIVGRGRSRASLEPLKRRLDVTLNKLIGLGTITADPRIETALVRQQEQRPGRTE